MSKELTFEELKIIADAVIQLVEVKRRKLFEAKEKGEAIKN